MSWDAQLERASFRNVEFDCQVIDDEISRRLAEHKYPYRSGAEFEDMGREPRLTRVRAVFMGPEYEADLGVLLARVDEGKAGTFQHPIMGSWRARVRRAPVHHEHGMRDIAIVELEVVEDGVNTSLPDLFSVAVAQAECYSSAELLAAAMAAYEDAAGLAGAIGDVIADVQAFADDVTSFVNKVADTVNQIRAKINAGLKFIKKVADVKNWPVARALRKVAHSVQKLGKAVQSLSPPALFKTIGATMSVTALAHSLYGDGSRSSQLLAMNKIRNPFLVPVGTRLKVYAK
jgi:prophage DNA circulation protein